MFGCQIAGLAEVIGKVVQLPHVLAHVVGREALQRLGREVPRGLVEPGACPPAVLVDGTTAVHLEVLQGVTFVGIGIVEGVGEARAVHRFLGDPVDRGRLGDADHLEQRRRDVDAVGELGAQISSCGDPPRPGDDHRIPVATEVAGHLLPPRERGVVGVGPGRREVRCGVLASQLLDAPVLVDERELLLGLEHDTVEEGRLVERAGDRALHARTVVPPDVDDDGVVQLAHLLDRVEQPSDVPVGVLRISGEHLHLTGVEPLLGLVQRIPGGEEFGALGELGVLRDDPEALLAFEGLHAVGVPSVVELALVLVGPLLADVVRGVAAAGGVVHEPRLCGVVRPDRMQPLDRLVGDVVGEVVELAVVAFGDTDHRVVLGDDRIVLTGRSREEPPPMVEAPAKRPVVERTSRTHLATRRQVPLAEAAGHVAVLLQDPGQPRATPRTCARVARERTGELGDATHADTVVVASRQETRRGWVSTPR